MKDAMTIHDISRVFMATKTLPPMYFYTRRIQSLASTIIGKSKCDYWYPKLYVGVNSKYLEIFKHHVENNFPYDSSLISHESDHEGMES